MRRIVIMLMGTLSGLLVVLAYPTSRGQTVTEASGASSGPGAAPSSAAGKAPGGSGVVTSAGTSTTGGTASPTSSGADATVPPSMSAPASASSGVTTVVRSFTGDVSRTRWGSVQIRAIMANERLLDVVAEQWPSGNSHSDQINNYALPILRKQALDAQSARIDGVSGATVTSKGYITSLQSALDQALA